MLERLPVPVSKPYWERFRDRPDVDVKVNGCHVDVMLTRAVPLDAVLRRLGVRGGAVQTPWHPDDLYDKLLGR